MGVTKKKPAVVAKTTKKRGRPVGSKNKPKFDGQVRAKAAKALIALGGTVIIDWEALSKRLQEALATEMKTVEKYETASFFDRLVYLFTGKL